MIITKTPFRISFVGGGTDIKEYYQTGGGAVVNASIDKYVYVSVHKRFDESIRVSYTKTEIVDCAQDLKHDIVRACMGMAGIENGVEITSISEIPAGTGLGSSSSLTVGVLNALYLYQGLRLSSNELAQKACEIEIGVLGQPIGKQDQYAAAYGGLNYFEFLPDESVTCRHIELSEEDKHRMTSELMMFYTGLTHDSGTILAGQKKSIASKLATLDDMKKQAGGVYRNLTTKGYGTYFGTALHEGWIRKQSLTSDISSDYLNDLYERAMKAGARGGKLLGAGGGGFFLFCVAPRYQEKVRKALGLKEFDFRITSFGSEVVYYE
jgi:D-glycero-alpha-D-manno-heptose-7-phosphate kinase